MIDAPHPDYEVFSRQLQLEPETGKLFWKLRKGRCKMFTQAGTYNRGYIHVKVNGIVYVAHHIVWLLTYGEWPPNNLDVDHINHLRADNRPINLRLVTRKQNALNRHTKSNCKSGYTGVRLLPSGRYQARSRLGLLGVFDTAEAASIAYQKQLKEAGI